MLAVYFIPTFIALKRRHAYKWVILGINTLGCGRIPWLIAFIWAVWPANKSLIDPAGNVTGKGTEILGILLDL